MSPIKTAAWLLFTITLLSGGRQTLAQEQRLSLEEAVRIGLAQNFDIRIANRQQDINENNVTVGKAGFLPTLSARATRTYSVNNSRREFQAREPSVLNGAKSNNTTRSVNLNWVIFDGLGMFINYERLQAMERSGELLTKATVQDAVADVVNAYFEVVRQGQKIEALQDAIAISKERVDITQAQYEVGVSAKVEILRAQVDYNADRSELLQQMELFQNAKISLNQLLGRDPNIDFIAADTMVVDASLDIKKAGQHFIAGNPLLERLRVSRELAYLDLRSVRAARFPTIGFTSAYNFSKSESEPLDPFQSNLSRNKGFNYGLTLSLPLFDGFNLNRQAQNARIAIDVNALALMQEQNRLEAEVARAFNRYTNRLQLLELESSNLDLAQQNAAIALERYRLGLLTAIELREAQRNRLVAENRLIDIKYEAKAAETELKRISSTLLEESNL